MKKMSNVTNVTLTQLKNDIRAMSVRIFLMKEKCNDLGYDELHEVAELLRETADTVDEWGHEKENTYSLLQWKSYEEQS